MLRKILKKKVKPLTNHEIEEAAAGDIRGGGIPNFRGVFMRDSLPSSSERYKN